jgi:hypothetical protein
MRKQSLRNTNPYLKDPEKQQELIAVSISSSSAIEVIRISPEEILTWQQSPLTPPQREPNSGE